jgi:transcriptional regulator with XRE-family HTH domain
MGLHMTTTLTLGQAIRSRRTELALTQEELAERIGEGVRQAEVSRLERDRIGLPRRARLERIATALELPLGELLARSGWAGADTVEWAPHSHVIAPMAKAQNSPDPAIEQSTDLAATSHLSAMIEQARETINRTHELLSRSDQMYDLVCRSVYRIPLTEVSAETENTP